MRRAILMSVIAAVITACATSPFETGDRHVARLSPAEARERPGQAGATVIWGGRIVGVVNTGRATELEVLSLPLGSGDRPRRQAEGGARFVIRHRGFLDPMIYAPGRHVTALGAFEGVESRSVGAFPVDHPVLASDQLELWPVEPNSSRGNISLGIGIQL